MNFCKLIADIEKDPTAIVPPMKVRDFQALKEHVKECTVCSIRIDRTLATAPENQLPKQGTN